MTISQDQGQDPQPRKRLGPADRARDDARLEAGPGSVSSKKSEMNVFLNAKGDMFSRLNVDKRIEMTRREWLLILVFFGLIVVSAAARYAIIILDMKKNDESNKNVLNNFDEMERELLANSFDDDEQGRTDALQELRGRKEDFSNKRERLRVRNVHMIYSVALTYILLPILFILGIIREKLLNLMLQIALAILAIVVSVLNQVVIGEVQDTHKTSTCKKEGSCNHTRVSSLLYGGVLLFSLTTIVRCFFHTRFKQWVTNIRCIGPFIENFAGRASRDFQALVLMLFLAFSIVSGIVLNKKLQLRDSAVKGAKDERSRNAGEPYTTLENTFDQKWNSILDEVSSVTSVLWLMLSFWIYAQVHHRFTHIYRVSEEVFLEEMQQLGDKHKDATLDFDRQNIQRTGYSPITEPTELPATSGQLIEAARNYDEEAEGGDGD